MTHRFLKFLCAVLVGLSSLILDRTGFGAELPSCCSKELAAGQPLSDKSIYQADSTWTADNGATVKLISLRGRPQVVAMFFARCEFACPLLVNDMKRIEAALSDQLRTNVGFVLISFDFERDTPSALAAYREQHDLGPNWTLLTGASDDVQEAAALLGVKFKKDARGQFAHSNLITLLNAGGEVALQQAGLNQPGSEIIAMLERLSKSRATPETKP